MNNKNISKLIVESLAIEAESAKEANALGYMARVLTQATLPHSRVSGSEFTRTNGMLNLSILTPEKIGIPYGTIPRLLLSWLTTEAVKTKNIEIVLGNNLSDFMSQLGLIPTGGRWGTIKRLREQMHRLFSSSISCQYENDELSAALGLNVAKEYCLWWNPKQPEQIPLWQSTVTLSKDFFDEITNKPVPIDLRALKIIGHSSLALDIYCWLTYRMSYLKDKTSIPWETLEVQFGANYERTRDFKRQFIRQLRAVSVVYPEAKVESDEANLILRPSKPHVPIIARE